MSGIKPKDYREAADSDVVCLLQCAHPPGKPLQLWLYNGLLSEVPSDKDYDVMSEMWRILHYLYPEEIEEG